jgi:hypothetical protein
MVSVTRKLWIPVRTRSPRPFDSVYYDSRLWRKGTAYASVRITTTTPHEDACDTAHGRPPRRRGDRRVCGCSVLTRLERTTEGAGSCGRQVGRKGVAERGTPRERPPQRRARHCARWWLVGAAATPTPATAAGEGDRD